MLPGLPVLANVKSFTMLVLMSFTLTASQKVLAHQDTGVQVYCMQTESAAEQAGK